MRLDDNKIHIFMHGTIVFWCRCTEEFPPSLTRVDILALCMATGGAASFKQTAAGWGLGRVSFKLQYCSLGSIPRTLARGHRRPCRNSQFQANPAHGASTFSRKSRNNFRGPPRRLARGACRAGDRHASAGDQRRGFGSPEARLRGSLIQIQCLCRRGTHIHRRNQDTRRRDASRRYTSKLLQLLKLGRSPPGQHQTWWPTICQGVS